MSVAKDKPTGLWYYVFKVKNPITGKISWKKKRGFETKRDALNAEADAQRLAQDTSGELTFREMAHQWESYHQSSKTMIEKHWESFNKRFAEYLNVPIKKITKKELANWYNMLSKSEYSTSTKNHTISYVKSVFRYASMIYDINDISSILHSFKKTDEEIMKEMDIWTVNEFNKFIKYVDIPIYKLFFKFLFWTGCRRGEAIALQKSDFKDGWVNIHASQKHHKNGLKPTKTKATRVVQLDDKLIEDIQPLLNGNGYLFGGNHGLSITQIQMQFKKAIKASGVKNIRLHDLRHSHATILINNGINIVAVSKRLGHADIETTLKTYTHLLSDTNKELIDKINAIKT